MIPAIGSGFRGLGFTVNSTPLEVSGVQGDIVHFQTWPRRAMQVRSSKPRLMSERRTETIEGSSLI